MDKIKKFNDYTLNINSDNLISENINLGNMEMGIDLTLINDYDYVYKKTIEYLNGHK
jgi:hypothetical protein